MLQVTVPKGRLTLTSIMMLDEPKLAQNGVHFLRYGVDSRLDLGVGYWATPGRPRPAVNWQAVPQSATRPALLFGYGSEPVGRWQDDGVYASVVKGFGAPHRRAQLFLAYFREIDEGTNHLIGGVSRSFDDRWTLYVGHYPFHTWDGSVNYQLTPRIQLGLWACDFTRSTKFGLSIGTGWSMRK